LSWVCKYFNRSRTSIKRWLHKAKNTGLIQEFEIGSIHKDSYIYVKYSSVKKLNELTLGNFAKATIPVDDIQDITLLKLRAYEIAISAQQARATFAISRNKDKKTFIPYPEEKPKSGKGNKRRSKRAKGCDLISHKGDNLFINKSYEAVGASQITLSLNLDKSRLTIMKWAGLIPHYHIFQGIPEEDRRLGYRVTYKAPKKRPRFYLRRANYYITTLYAKRDKRAYGASPIQYTPLEPKKEKPLSPKQRAKELLSSINPKTKLSTIPKEDTVRQKLNSLSAYKLKDLASALLIRFSGREKDDPQLLRALERIQVMSIKDLIHSTEQTILVLREDPIKKEEVFMMIKRRQGNKTALAPIQKIDSYVYRDIGAPGLD
jgi:hypothetical protein